jgi:hypoxanthine phosphoribosyltransferase
MKRIGRPQPPEPEIRVLIGERRIRARVKQLARRLSTDYRGTVPVFIGILNGSFVFLADLIRELRIDCEVDFVKVSTWRGTAVRAGRMVGLLGLTRSVKNRHVIVVEDIVDTGASLQHIRSLVRRRNPATVRCVALLYKDKGMASAPKPEYLGFTIPPGFVAGYGLDLGMKMRNRKSIYSLTGRSR